MAKSTAPAERAVRATVAGAPDPAAFRDASIERAGEIGVLGWARDDGSEGVRVHAEGTADAVAVFAEFLRGAVEGEGVEVEDV